jgi:hypothetical protein
MNTLKRIFTLVIVASTLKALLTFLITFLRQLQYITDHSPFYHFILILIILSTSYYRYVYQINNKWKYSHLISIGIFISILSPFVRLFILEYIVDISSSIFSLGFHSEGPISFNQKIEIIVHDSMPGILLSIILLSIPRIINQLKKVKTGANKT